MGNFSQFVTDITTFNTSVLIPFITGFFSSTIGFTFIALICVVVVVHLLASLVYNKKF